jgi:ribosomal protein S18 acetylase RimI-like enzyme
MEVRPLSPIDAGAYRSLMLQGYEQAADAFTTTAQERAAEPLIWWQKRIQDSNGLSQAFGVLDAGVLLGSVAVEYSAKEKTLHKGLVVGMYVAPTHQNRGAGRALMQAVIAHAGARPAVRLLTLTVTEGNMPAIRLYESLGFRIFGVEPLAIHTGEAFKAKVHMALELPYR